MEVFKDLASVRKDISQYFPQLAELLGSANLEDRDAAIVVFVAVAASCEDVPTYIVKLLRDEKQDTRCAAIKVFKDLAGVRKDVSQYFPNIAMLWDDNDKSVCIAVAGFFKDVDVSEYLVQLAKQLKHQDTDVRCKAGVMFMDMAALGKNVSAAAGLFEDVDVSVHVQRVAKRLTHPNWDVRLKAVRYFGAMASKKALGKDMSEYVIKIAAQLKDRSPSFKIAAINFLKHMSDHGKDTSTYYQDIAKLVIDEDKHVRQAVHGFFKDLDVSEYLLQVAKQLEEPDFKYSAVSFFKHASNLGKDISEYYPKIFSLRKDKNPDIKKLVNDFFESDEMAKAWKSALPFHKKF